MVQNVAKGLECIEMGSLPSTSSCMGARNLFSVKRHPPDAPAAKRGHATNERAQSQEPSTFYTPSATPLMEERRRRNHDLKIMPS